VAPDINGDGKPDVVFTHAENGNTISVGLSNGNGTFSTSFWVGWPGSGQGTQPSTSYFPDGVIGFDVVAGDFNGDGVMDFAVPVVGADQARGGVSIMLGKTPGTFRAPRVYQPLGGDFRSFGPPTRADYAFGDFTSNGKQDLAVLAGTGRPPQALLDIFPGNGDGSFGDSLVATVFPACNTGAGALRSVDLAQNGTLDLVFLGLASGGQDHLFVASGNGNGTFTLFSSVPLTNIRAQNMVVADFNGDGFPDVAVSEFNACPPRRTIEVFLQGAGGTKTFTSKSILSVAGDCPPNATTGSGLVAADFDHDGKVDLIASTVTNGVYNALFFKGNGDGTFQDPTVIGTGTFGRDGINDYAAADLDGDGNLDLVGVGNGVLVQLGNGDGTFQAPVNYAPSSGTALRLADFDGDGKLDMAL
ncbi:MAG: hypothetical protein DMD81_16220, partial [Candidatus Rokuibacteriota bacterium]